MEESASTIEVTVKTLDSRSRSYTVRRELTLKRFKEHISASVDIPVEKQRLIYQGRVLQDERTLNDYNVADKVIHLVERAPPQTSQSAGGRGRVSSGGTEGGATSSSQGGPQDRNGNSYVMLGTFNLPVNIMDPQQIQMQVQQMMAGVGEAGRNTRVSTSTGRNGSIDMHINVDQSVQSEPRMRLQLAENLLRETQSLLHRLEVVTTRILCYAIIMIYYTNLFSPSDVPSRVEPETSQSTSSASSTAATKGALSLSHPSPAELVEVLSEVRRVEERLGPFIERTNSILGAATSADYINNTQEREEDLHVLNLVGEALRLLGNTLVALSDLRCNLATPPPRHLHVVRPMSHYGSPVLLQGGMPHHVPRNLGTTVTMTSNGRQAAEGLAQPSQAPGPPESQALPPQPNSANQQPGQGQGAPHVIRITHQTIEPVVMMQMNLDDSGSSPQVQGQIPIGTGQPGATPVHIPDLPPEFMQAIVHQISQQTGQPGPGVPGTTSSSEPSAPHSLLPPGARVVVTHPSSSPHIPQPVVTNINLGASVPSTGGQHNLQVRQGDADMEKSVEGLWSGCAALLLHAHSTDLFFQGTPLAHSPTSTSSSLSTSSNPVPPLPSGETTSGQTTTSVGQPSAGVAEANLAQFLGSLLGGAGGPGAPGAGANPQITVTVPGVPGFFHGMSEFTQANQPVFSRPTTSPGQEPPPGQGTPAPPQVAPGGVGDPSLSPELFTGIVQGVLSTMMGAPQGNGESIAQFIHRLSQTTNLFTPGSGDAVGFFGDLLSLVGHSFSMVDMVLLLHGNAQPISRIQPQLTDFFNQHYLQGPEPTDANINAASEDLINGLEEYITESFATVTVREGVDIIQTNIAFLRQQFTCMATHILRCTDHMFGHRLLLLCTQGLFECLALNLYCLRGEQGALTQVLNHHIRRMSAEVNPSLVNWLTSIMTMRLHVILEHNPVTEDHIQHYVIHTWRAGPEAQAYKDTACLGTPRKRSGNSMTSARKFTEWVPIIRHDMLSQRKITQPPLSDAYHHGMPAKRRKVSGPQLSLSVAVSRAARATGAIPVTSPDSLQGELEEPELQDAYQEQVMSDIKERVRGDQDFSSQCFPNTHRAFSLDDS
uniref:Large proline-rich protein BAG6 n=1 Tax=Oncorhynchus mykiss TaxID=8022 RepID=A0A8C7W7T1_ONCMY